MKDYNEQITPLNSYTFHGAGESRLTDYQLPITSHHPPSCTHTNQLMLNVLRRGYLFFYCVFDRSSILSELIKD